MAKVDVVYQVVYCESERGWGQSFFSIYYENEELAKAAMVECDSKNTAATAPDYYVQSYEGPTMVERSKLPKAIKIIKK